MRYILHVNKNMNPRAKRVCLMNGCEANDSFALKSIIREYPLTFIFWSFLITILMLAY